MSVPFAIDFGNMHSVMAVARNNGTDIIVNELSNRTTPSIVGFGEKKRYIGEEGKMKQSSNIINTVANLQTLLGLVFDTPDFRREQPFINTAVVEYSNNFVGVEVNYQGQLISFSPVQLVSMYLNKLRKTAENEIETDIANTCITIPTWYTEERKVALLDACKIAGLRTVQLVDNLTAVAVYYGLTKPDLPLSKQKARIVGFFDCGYSTTSFSIVAFHQERMKVLATCYVKDLGGRNFDRAITEYLADEFKQKYKIDIRGNKKAYFRIMTQAEKLKKVLSVNQVGKLNEGCLMDNIDVSAEMTRGQFEELLEPLVIEHIDRCIIQAFHRAYVDNLDAIELLGGSTRIPLIKNLIEQASNISLSSTLNQDEAAVKGAALISAMYCSNISVRPFKFKSRLTDINITLCWDKSVLERKSSIDLFPNLFSKLVHYPTKKSVVIDVSSDFTIAAHRGRRHMSCKDISEIDHNLLGIWVISGIKPEEIKKTQSNIHVELVVSCDVSRFLHIEEAYVIDQKDNRKHDQEKSHRRYKRKYCLNVKSLPISPNADNIIEWIQLEKDLIKQDQLVEDTEEHKNELESSIYSLRSKLDGVYADVIDDREKKYTIKLLSDTEDWLYGEGEDTTIEKYDEKYNEIKAIVEELNSRQ